MERAHPVKRKNHMPPKVTAAALAGALVVVGCWIFNLIKPNIQVPPAVASALITIVTVFIAFVFPEDKPAGRKAPAPRQKRNRAGSPPQLTQSIPVSPFNTEERVAAEAEKI
jgi:hypothetical protein